MTTKVTVFFCDGQSFEKDFEFPAIATQFAFEVFKNGVTFEREGSYHKYPGGSVIKTSMTTFTEEAIKAVKRKRK